MLKVSVAALLFFILAGCAKNSSSQEKVQSPEAKRLDTTTGILHYYSPALDGPGLYYRTDGKTLSGADTDDFFLLSNRGGGYYLVGENLDSIFHQYIDVHTQLIFRKTGKTGKMCGQNGTCSETTVVDTIAFSIIP